MTAELSTPSQVLFTVDEVNQAPFRHAVISRVFAEHVDLNRVIEWFERDAPWKLHEEDFFSQYDFRINASTAPEPISVVFGRPILDRLRKEVERLFGVRLSERMTVVAHKLEAGQGIGIHTDCPAGPEWESFRLVVGFTPSYEDKCGGHLLLFRSDDATALARIFRPVINTAVAFELSNSSFHAVSEVSGSCRYSVVFSFWKEIEGENDEELSRVSDWLKLKRADSIPHSGSELIGHLEGVYQLLSKWRVRSPLRLAGLLHSIYSTESFDPEISVTREEVRKEVGEDAEDIVYRFSTLARKKFYEQILNCSDELIGTSDFRENIDLAILDFANSLEQFRRNHALTPSARELQAHRRAVAASGNLRIALAFADYSADVDRSLLQIMDPEHVAKNE